MQKPDRALILIGFMGAGKSAVGRALAGRLGWPRHDTDEIIRHQFGMSIPEIFDQHGENVFRDAETTLLRRFRATNPFVLVTGGGILLREENSKLLAQLGTRIWLDAAEEKLWQRASRREDRPLLRAADPRKKFSGLLRARCALYETAADHRLDTSERTIEEVAFEIMSLP